MTTTAETALREPGFYDYIPEADYHGDPTSLSVTGAKVLLRAPALYRWQQDHPVQKDVFDFGHAAHAKVLGVGQDIRVIPSDLLGANGATSTKAAKEFIAQARADGAVPLKADDAAAVDAMAAQLGTHHLAKALLSEGRPEVSAYAVDGETGVMRRGRMDWLGSHILTDYKTTTSADPRDLAGRYGAIAKWGYDSQAAWYLDLARDLDHPAEAFAFIFQMKEPPYLVTVAQVDERDLTAARSRNRMALEMFRDCTASGLWPGFVPDDHVVVVSLTDQDYDTEIVE